MGGPCNPKAPGVLKKQEKSKGKLRQEKLLDIIHRLAQKGLMARWFPGVNVHVVWHRCTLSMYPSTAT